MPKVCTTLLVLLVLCYPYWNIQESVLFEKELNKCIFVYSFIKF